ncbi:hypothetical protein ACLESO_00560 [Pyxidicoccus sp. 3LG]
MGREGEPGFVRLWGGVLLGALLVGCGPVSEDVGPGVADVAQVEEARASGAGTQAFVPAPLARFEPAVAYGGGKYFAVWADVRTGGVYGTRIKQDGTVLDPEGIRINIGDEDGGRPAIAYNGTHFFVIWETSDGVDGVRVRPDGTVVGPVFRLIQSGESSGPVSIACSELVCMGTFHVDATEGTDVFFTRVTRDGVVLVSPDRSVTPGDFFTGAASIAWNNSSREFLIVWLDSRGGGEELEDPDIYGNRVTEGGTVLDGEGFPIAAAPGAQRFPDVTWSGRRYHVVWSDTRNGSVDIFGARVRPDGSVEDPDGIPISTAPGEQNFPRVAHHNSKSLVVWDDTRDGSHRIWGARLGEDGAVWDPSGFAISSGDQPEEFLPDVAYGADRFFTAYAAGAVAEPVDPPHFILGTRVNHQAQVKDSPALPLTQEP